VLIILAVWIVDKAGGCIDFAAPGFEPLLRFSKLLHQPFL